MGALRHAQYSGRNTDGDLSKPRGLSHGPNGNFAYYYEN